MSGGHFNYQYYSLETIASEIEDLIETNNDTGLDRFGEEIGRHYPPEIIKKFEETRDALQRASKMLKRVDWLVSGDDGEDSFLRRWDEEGLGNDKG